MTKIQIKLLSLLDDHGWDVFTKDMLLEEAGLSAKEVWEALRYLTKNGSITRIERGKYHRSNFLDSNVIACSIVENSSVAYWTALNMHGLTEQIPNVIFIQNSKRNGYLELKKSGITIRFINVAESKLFGSKQYSYGNHIWRITDIEKTIIDSFELPKYSGGFPETIKAINNAHLHQNKLIKYCKKQKNTSVTLRLAYLIEILKKPNMNDFLMYAQTLVGKNYILFEAGLPKTRVTNTKWKINLNISESEILEIANSGTQ